jgi:hypothetical protein
VKAFNNIYFKHLLSLARPTWAADRSYLPIAADFAPARAAVTEFIDSLGYSVVDAGPLAESWRQATGTPVWGTPYGPYSNEEGQPASEDAIRAALATATRLPQGGAEVKPALVRCTGSVSTTGTGKPATAARSLTACGDARDEAEYRPEYLR